VDHGYPQAGQVKFGGFAGSPRTDVGTVVVSEDGMYWRVARQLLEEARHADVAGVQDHLSREECSAIPGGSASRIAGVCVGEDPLSVRSDGFNRFIDPTTQQRQLSLPASPVR
jgi:hypothetical protein